MITVLITGCSKHSKGIIDCLRSNKDNEYIRVIGVDCNESNILKTGVDHRFIVPKVTDKSYLVKLRNICTQLGVNVILPYITSELEILSQNKAYFEEVGVHVSVSSLESLKIANNKIALYDRFGKYMPAQLVPSNKKDVEEFIKTYGTVCCKITDGCGGTGFAIVDNEKAYDMKLFNKARVNRYISEDFLYECLEKNQYKNIILQEYIDGIDYSTCALSDNGKLIGICGYEGYAMEYGAVINGKIIKSEKAYDIHREIIEEIGMDGNSCADFIVTKDDVKLLEINPRLNASLPFVAEAGANFVYDRCKMLLGKELDGKYDIKYGMGMSKYYETEYF